MQRASLHIAETLRPRNEDDHTLIEQRNPNGQWRLLVDRLMINKLKFDDYTNNTQPVSTSSDAVQHLPKTSFTTTRGSVPKAGNIPLGRYLCPESGELAHIGKYIKKEKLDSS